MTEARESVERPLVFRCGSSELAGILHEVTPPPERGVVIVVGGPQYRVGSHRQFVLLARALADCGIPVLRFDYRGLGDSAGELRKFDEVQSDIRSAVDALCEEVPSVKEVVLWGLCDAASAAAFYAGCDQRVAGLVLANPWVRTDEGQARTELRHYYVARVREAAFWRKLIRMRWNPLSSIRSIGRAVREVGKRAQYRDAQTSLPKQVQQGLEAFDGNVLLVLSGQDLTAREFEDAVALSRAWSDWRAGDQVTERRLEEADHTFSREAWRDQVACWTVEWLRGW